VHRRKSGNINAQARMTGTSGALTPVGHWKMKCRCELGPPDIVFGGCCPLSGTTRGVGTCSPTGNGRAAAAVVTDSTERNVDGHHAIQCGRSAFELLATRRCATFGMRGYRYLRPWGERTQTFVMRRRASLLSYLLSVLGRHCQIVVFWLNQSQKADKSKSKG